MKLNNNINKVAEVRLSYKTKVNPSDRPVIKQSKDAYDIFISQWNPDTLEYVEEFKILLLNRANKVLGTASISLGGTAGTITDVKIILQYALKTNALGLIACHNHPSGNLNPSESDSKLTKKLKDAATIMDIQLLDHIIIAPGGGYYSFADEGML
ncbi:MAG: JAB domain-containing protein [Bacteroidales bacterium]|nr:JAB domain-containing protein [Bacteroidales bacterium]